MFKRLVSFLGTNSYETTRYSLEGEEFETTFVVSALVRFLKPDEVVVIATSKAREANGQKLRDELQSKHQIVPSFRDIPNGETEDELWQQFGLLSQLLLPEAEEEVIIDISHGWRAQPFFASACVQFIGIESPDYAPTVYYGSYERGRPINAIWNLSAFSELLRWTRALDTFLQTGRAAQIAELTRSLGVQTAKKWHEGGRLGAAPTLKKLGTAIQDYSDAFSTLRVGHILLSNNGSKSLAGTLLEALEASRDEVERRIPAFASVFNRVIERVRPLVITDRLSQPLGQKGLQALARLYLVTGCYAEATAVIREGWVTKFAQEQSDAPGQPEFSQHSREAADNCWFEAHQVDRLADSMTDLRNDFLHAGFRRHMKKPKTIKENVKTMLETWESET